MKDLLPFQKEAVEKIIEFYNSSEKHAKISLSTGLGTRKILMHAVDEILSTKEKCKILYLCGTNSEVYEFQEQLVSFSKRIQVVNFLPDLKINGIFLSDYKSILTTTIEIDYNFFDLIICDSISWLNDSVVYPFFDSTYTGKRLSITRTPAKNNLVKNDKLIFKYNIEDAMESGYFCTTKELDFLNVFFSSLLSHLHFQNIKCEEKYRDYGVDITGTYQNQTYVFEIKNYRTEMISESLVESSCRILTSVIKNQQNMIPIMVITSSVSNELKRKIYKETKIEIWDISNLIYLSKVSPELQKKLESYVSYPLSNKISQPPLFFEINKNIKVEKESKGRYQEFEQALNNCPAGKNNSEDKEFERICTDIITYLFQTEFFQMSTQHRTNDELFRMDMICSLKGTTAFWKFLMQFYNTKFVVFEYKNYNEELSQNLIFIASKYLFPEALRSVAFIISRHGLKKNAQLVVDSKIKSEKKLIISLTDEDLLIMVAAKDQGKDPSDYLLEKVEKMLMALSVY